MGLETAHPGALARLNKGCTLDDFAAAARALAAHGVGLRVFLLVHPPFVPHEDRTPWLLRSIDAAIDAGASMIALIPTRGDTGAMEALTTEGLFAPPSLATLEDAAAQAIRHAAGRARVLADLWDLAAFATCPACLDARRARLLRLNLEQRVPVADRLRRLRRVAGPDSDRAAHDRRRRRDRRLRLRRGVDRADPPPAGPLGGVARARPASALRNRRIDDADHQPPARGARRSLGFSAAPRRSRSGAHRARRLPTSPAASSAASPSSATISISPSRTRRARASADRRRQPERRHRRHALVPARLRSLAGARSRARRRALPRRADAVADPLRGAGRRARRRTARPKRRRARPVPNRRQRAARLSREGRWASPSRRRAGCRGRRASTGISPASSDGTRSSGGGDAALSDRRRGGAPRLPGRLDLDPPLQQRRDQRRCRRHRSPRRGTAADDGGPAWARLLDRLPSVRDQFARAEPTFPIVHAPRLGFRVRRVVRPHWALLPSAAGVIDPLLSTGFALTLLGIQRLTDALPGLGPADPGLRPASARPRAQPPPGLGPASTGPQPGLGPGSARARPGLSSTNGTRRLSWMRRSSWSPRSTPRWPTSRPSSG